MRESAARLLKLRYYGYYSLTFFKLLGQSDSNNVVCLQVELARQKIEEMSKEQENLIAIFTEERDRRDVEEESLRNKLEVPFLLIH